MPLKIRQRKNEDQSQHPDYMLGRQRTWVDDERERGRESFRRNFIAIIAVIVVVAVILVVAAVNAIVPVLQEQQISAADTFAVSQYEQQQMEDKARTFAQGILVYAYCSDQATAFEGKNAALQTMANSTTSYSEVMNMRQVNPSVDPDDFAPIVTNVMAQTNSQVYAGAYVYELDAVVVDLSVTSDDGEAGAFVDRGYHMVLTFDYVQDDATGEDVWVISNAQVNSN